MWVVNYDVISTLCLFLIILFFLLPVFFFFFYSFADIIFINFPYLFCSLMKCLLPFWNVFSLHLHPDLRKQARQLENELDLKLVSFSKLCTSYSSSSNRDQRTRDSRSAGHFTVWMFLSDKGYTIQLNYIYLWFWICVKSFNSMVFWEFFTFLVNNWCCTIFE